MRTLKRDKKPLYLCKLIEGSEPRQYEKPKQYFVNHVAVASKTDLMLIGDQDIEQRKFTLPVKYLKDFNEGDKVYVYNKPPFEHDPLCEKADYEIFSIVDGISQVKVVMRKLQIG